MAGRRREPRMTQNMATFAEAIRTYEPYDVGDGEASVILILIVLVKAVRVQLFGGTT